MAALDLWVEKYRPKTLDDYVWRDEDMKRKVVEWVDDGRLPHLLLSGRSGTGKTSLAELLMRLLGIPNGDILRIAASRERGIDSLQSKLGSFVSTWALNETGIKYVILDEADRLSPIAQDLLRNDMETYADACRFILTCNQRQRIIAPVIGRCQEYTFETLEEDDFLARLADVLVSEDVQFDVDTIMIYMKSYYPDLRKAIGQLQNNTSGGELRPPKASEASGENYLPAVLDLFRANRFIEGRKLLIKNAQPEEYSDIFQTFYRNLDLFGDDQDDQDSALLIIRDAMLNHPTATDPEINLAAMLVELTRFKSPTWQNK